MVDYSESFTEQCVRLMHNADVSVCSPLKFVMYFLGMKIVIGIIITFFLIQ
jgi:hypothetical protein